MSVRGFRPADIAAGAFWIASIAAAVWFVLTDPARSYPLLAVAASQAVAAVACREAGMRRWRDVDWLEVRPPRRSGLLRAVQTLTAE